MKLSCLLLLALAAVVVADSSEYYQNYETEYSQESSYDQGAPSPNYYSGQKRRTARQQSGLSGILKKLFGFGATPASLAPYLLLGLLFGLGTGALVGAFASLDFNSSGRGLDTDEWEVDHSVWMNQLQKDFEDSWSTE
ncbi:hypothetical protein FJT64_011609 [Amphibalanus amphitrite]|uniref:Uncharacterized protein n=1 Tax=Amphibalanus amphitrite TaxID=1232801 RepID=A0A6A4VAM6_AMPAM|nr:hypothetical protein FJT64_011609 [Amphibalanus amphitrite]